MSRYARVPARKRQYLSEEINVTLLNSLQDDEKKYTRYTKVSQMGFVSGVAVYTVQWGEGVCVFVPLEEPQCVTLVMNNRRSF